jgi:hypothetical protein
MRGVQIPMLVGREACERLGSRVECWDPKGATKNLARHGAEEEGSLLFLRLTCGSPPKKSLENFAGEIS